MDAAILDGKVRFPFTNPPPPQKKTEHEANGSIPVDHKYVVDILLVTTAIIKFELLFGEEP